MNFWTNLSELQVRRKEMKLRPEPNKTFGNSFSVFAKCISKKPKPQNMLILKSNQKFFSRFKHFASFSDVNNFEKKC